MTAIIYIHAWNTTCVIMIELNHRQLQEELCSTKSMAINEVPLGAVRKNKNRVPRADVVQIRPSYDSFCVIIYDIKRTRADLLSSLRTRKWEKYLEHCNLFYFACVKGIFKKGEIPEGVGLVVRGDNGWYTPTAAQYRDVEIPRETMKSIMFHRVKEEWNVRRKRQLVQNRRLGSELKNMGKDVNKALRFYDNFYWQIDLLKKNGYL